MSNQVLPWKDLERAKMTVDALRGKVRDFLRPEPAVGREVPCFFTRVFEFNNRTANGAVPVTGQVISKQILNDTAQLVRLTSMTYDVRGTLIDANQNEFDTRLRMITNGVMAVEAQNTKVGPPVFDFEWNFRHERTQRDYANRFLSRESLGNPEKGEPLTFPCYLELERSDNLTISVKPTLLPNYWQAVAGYLANGDYTPVNIKLHITFSGYRVRS